MRKSKTHFEQIPLEVVKKIAEEEVSDNKAIGNEKVIAKIPAQKTKPYAVAGRWLCRKAI